MAVIKEYFNTQPKLIVLKIKPKGQDMTGNFSVLHEGSTLIGDHKAAVQALEDVLVATTAAEAKEIVTTALKKLGEIAYTEADVEAASPPHETENLTTR